MTGLLLYLKDMKLMLRDKKGLLFLVLMPTILSIILGFSLNFMFSQESDISKLVVAIVDHDTDDNTTERLMTLANRFGYTIDPDALPDFNVKDILYNDFLGNEELKKILGYTIVDQDKAEALLKNMSINGILIIPKNFSYNLAASLISPMTFQTELVLITHPERTFTGGILETIIKSFTDSLSGAVIASSLLYETAIDQGLFNQMIRDLPQLTEEAISQASSNINVTFSHIDGNKRVSSFQYYSAAIGVMYLLFTAGYGGKMLLEEKELMTYHRTLIAPVSRWSIVAAKFFTLVTFGMIQLNVLMLVSGIFFKAYWGSFIDAQIIALTVSFASAGLGSLLMAISSRSGNFKSGIIFQSVILWIMALLGGSFISIYQMPPLMQSMADYTINGLALKAFLNIMEGGGLQEVSSNLIILTVSGIILTLIGIVILRSEGE